MSSYENSFYSDSFSEEILSGEESDIDDIYPYNYFSPRKIQAGNFDLKFGKVLSQLAFKI